MHHSHSSQPLEESIVVSKPATAAPAPAPPRPSDRLAKLRAALGRAETDAAAAAADVIAAQRVVERAEAAHTRCIGIGDKLRVRQRREIGRLTDCTYGLTNASKRQAAIDARAAELSALSSKARREREDQEAAALEEALARHDGRCRVVRVAVRTGSMSAVRHSLRNGMHVSPQSQSMRTRSACVRMRARLSLMRRSREHARTCRCPVVPATRS